MARFEPSDVQIEDLTFDIANMIEPDIEEPEVAALTGRSAFQSIIRAAQVEALREAAFSGHFGTTAQSTLLRRAERMADEIEG